MSIRIQSADDLKAKLNGAGNKVVILYFTAAWCGPCEEVGPVVEQVAKEMAGSIVVIKVDYDKFADIVANYKIEEIPTFVFIKSNKKMEEFTGCSGAEELRSTVLKYK